MKAIIVDLDRTLLRTDKTLSFYTINVLKKCHNKGFAVIAATARPERSILTYHEQVGFDAVITMNGAKIILPDEVIENSIPRLSGECVLSALISIPDTLISIETSDGIYSNAIEAAANAADYITDSNDKDGAAHFIEANLL